MELGWPLPRREEYFRDTVGSSMETKKIRFQGDYRIFPVFMAPIGLPKYRLENGRTVSLQSEWLAEHPGETADYFRRDPESERVQEIQHGLLIRLIKAKDMDKFFADIVNKQDDPIILDSHGFVVNGNRRICCWRELYESDSSKYSHFSHINVVVLPPADDRAIDKLENDLQVAKDIRDDYTWDALANMLYEKQQAHGYSDADLADTYKDMKPSEIRELLDMRDYAMQYMAWKGKPNHWTIVRGEGNYYAFQKLLKTCRRRNSPLEKRVLEGVVFTLIENSEGIGRLYEAIPTLGDNYDRLRERLVGELSISPSEIAPTDPTGFFVSETTGSGGSLDARLARAVENRENQEQLREVAKDVIEEARNIAAETRNAEYVRKRLQKAHTEIQNAINGINEASSREGVPEQIQAIDNSLLRIRAWANGNT